jgi:hypothetical protein
MVSNSPGTANIRGLKTNGYLLYYRPRVAAQTILKQSLGRDPVLVCAPLGHLFPNPKGGKKFGAHSGEMAKHAAGCINLSNAGFCSLFTHIMQVFLPV